MELDQAFIASAAQAAPRSPRHILGDGKLYSLFLGLMALAIFAAAGASLYSGAGGSDATDHFTLPRYNGDKTAIAAEYTRDIEAIIARNELAGITPAQVIEILSGLDRKYRARFFSGWRSYVAEGVADLRKKESVHAGTAMELTLDYANRFRDAMAAERTEAHRRGVERLILVGAAVGGALVVLILVPMVPLLIRIERNTRAAAGRIPSASRLPGADAAWLPTAAAPAPAPAAGKTCSGCGASNQATNLFCESCGAKF